MIRWARAPEGAERVLLHLPTPDQVWDLSGGLAVREGNTLWVPVGSEVWEISGEDVLHVEEHAGSVWVHRKHEIWGPAGVVPARRESAGLPFGAQRSRSLRSSADGRVWAWQDSGFLYRMVKGEMPVVLGATGSIDSMVVECGGAVHALAGEIHWLAPPQRSAQLVEQPRVDHGLREASPCFCDGFLAGPGAAIWNLSTMTHSQPGSIRLGFTVAWRGGFLTGDWESGEVSWVSPTRVESVPTLPPEAVEEVPTHGEVDGDGNVVVETAEGTAWRLAGGVWGSVPLTAALAPPVRSAVVGDWRYRWTEAGLLTAVHSSG